MNGCEFAAISLLTCENDFRSLSFLFSTPLFVDVLFLFTYDLELRLQRQFTILQKSGNFRIPESLPCLHDNLLAAAADATISLSPNQKITQVEVLFQAFYIFPPETLRYGANSFCGSRVLPLVF